MSKELYRIEIISNQSIEDDIIEVLEQEIPSIEYTVVPVVHGKGLKSKKLGTTTWPEENFMMFSYLELKDARKVKSIIEAIKLKFPNEGLVFFCTQVVDL